MNIQSRKHWLKNAQCALAAGVLVLIAALFACTGLPQAGLEAFGGLGKPSDPVPFMEQVRTGTLASGLRYFILENSLPENRAYLTLAVDAGSVLEADDERGLAHFVEHMAFNGTARFPETELVNYLRSLGMRFGPEVNAYTSFDQTVYGIEAPVETGDDGLKRIPDRALAILDDWTRAITFAPADVDDERAIIMEEYRSRLGAMDRIQRKMLPVLFRGSPYAERLPIGLPEIIEGAPASRLEGFYKKWYQADNMALILVGDFDGAALETSLAEHFSIAKPAAPVQRPRYDLPQPRKGNIETLILTDPELTATQITLYFKRPREAVRGDLSYYRNEVIDILIDRMLSFRFEDEIHKPETPYVYAGAGTIRYATSSRFYAMFAQAKTGGAEASLTALLRAKETALRYGFTEAELRIAASSLVSDLRRMADEKDRQYSERYVQALTNYYLEGGNLADVEWELEAVQKLLPAITAKDIAAAVKDYFRSNDLQVFIFAPEAEQASLPAEARIKRLVRESPAMKIAPPQAAVVDEGLLSVTPQRGAVVSQSVDADTGALRWDLSNGARVILKPTKNRNNEVVLHAMARGGTSSAAPADDISASLAMEMLQVSGLGPWPRSELMRKLADKQVSLGPYVSHYYRGFQSAAAAGDLTTLFELLYLSFTGPRIDPEAVRAMLDQYRSSLARRDENPDNVFSDEINRLAFGGHPHFKSLELADLPQADIDAALAFIKRGLNPADYTFVFTGNLDAETMRPLIETYLASIPASGQTWNAWTNLNIKRPGKTERTVYKGKEARSQVYMGWFNQIAYTEARSIAAQVLTEYLDIVMTEEIREKLGGVYSISVGASVSPIPADELSLAVYFACDPKRARELSAAVSALLHRVAASPLNLDTFTKSVAALQKEWETSIQSNAYIAQSYANSSTLLNQPLSRLDNRPRAFSAVTPADIQNLCAQALQNGPALAYLFPEGFTE